MTTVQIIILISIYIISVLNVRNWMRKAHSTNGRFSNLKTSLKDVFWTILPIANTCMMFIMLTMSPYDDYYKQSKNYNKFFGVKK
jgi:hypothetical protein